MDDEEQPKRRRAVDEKSPLLPRSRELTFFQLGLLGAVTSLTSASSDAYLPLAPAIQKEFGATLLVTSLGLQLNWIVSGLSAPVWGSASTLHGRKFVLLSGLGVFLAGTATTGTATTLFVFVAGRTVQGLGEGSARAIAEAIVCDVYTSGSERTRALAGISQWFTVSIITAPILGSVVGSYMGWRIVFAVLFGWGVLQAAALVAFIPETGPSSSGSTTTTVELRRAALRVRDEMVKALWSGPSAGLVTAGLCFNFSTNLFAGTILTLWPYVLELHYHLSVISTGLIVGSVGAIGTLGAQINKVGANYLSPATLLAIGVAAYFLVAITVLFAIGFFCRDDPSFIATVGAGYGFALVIFCNYPALVTVMLRGVGNDASGSIIGLNGGLMFIGLAIASIAASSVAQHWFHSKADPRASTILLSIYALISSAIYALFIYRPSMRSEALLGESSKVRPDDDDDDDEAHRVSFDDDSLDAPARYAPPSDQEEKR